MPAISIIIPTYNRAARVCRTAEQIRRQSVQDFELWIVDQSDRESAEKVAAYVEGMADPRIHYLHLAVKGHPNARNEGLARVSGPIVLFLDDDVILLGKDFLAAHINAYRDLRVGGVSGRIVERLIRPNTRRTKCSISLGGRVISNLFGHRRKRLSTLKGANMSYRRMVFRDVGGFDRNFVGAYLEDGEFSTRVRAAGWTLLFEPAAELCHLSSRCGGVRERAGDREANLYWRFRSTTYFVLRHRGIWGLPFFALTYGAIALDRSIAWRSPGTLLRMIGAVREGFEAWHRGADNAIP